MIAHFAKDIVRYDMKVADCEYQAPQRSPPSWLPVFSINELRYERRGHEVGLLSTDPEAVNPAANESVVDSVDPQHVVFIARGFPGRFVVVKRERRCSHREKLCQIFPPGKAIMHHDWCRKPSRCHGEDLAAVYSRILYYGTWWSCVRE